MNPNYPKQKRSDSVKTIQFKTIRKQSLSNEVTKTKQTISKIPQPQQHNPKTQQNNNHYNNLSYQKHQPFKHLTRLLSQNNNKIYYQHHQQNNRYHNENNKNNKNNNNQNNKTMMFSTSNPYNHHIHNHNHKQDNQQIVKFQPFKIPPNITQCHLHRIATQFGKPLQIGYHNHNNNQANTLENKQQSSKQQNNSNIHSPKRLVVAGTGNQPNNNVHEYSRITCPCCGQQPKQVLNINCRLDEIYNINQPLGFYFTYIKVICMLLFLMSASVGIYSFKEIISGCQLQAQCIYVYGIPVSKFHVFFTDTLAILNIMILFSMYFFIAYLYYLNAHIHRKMFLNHKKPSDYCVLISGVDHNKVNGVALIDKFEKYNIVDILYTHKIQKYIKKLSMKSIFIAKKNLYYKKGEDKKIIKLQEKIHKIDQQLLHIKNKLNLNQEKSLRTDKIIIKFKTPQQKNMFQQQYKEKMYQTIVHTFCGTSLIKINENSMYVQPLGQPHEIVWENLEIQSKQRYVRVFVGNVSTLVVLGGSYLGVTLLTKLEKQVQGAGDIILSIVFSIFIELVNFILDFIVQNLTNWQKRYTLTGKQGTVLIKNYASFFFNTTLIPFSLFLFAWGTSDEDDLIRNIFTLFIVSNFISPFITIYIQPTYIYALYKRRKIKKQGNQCIQTQIKANQYFQKMDFDLVSRYSMVLQRVTNCIFYAAVFPFGLIITFIGLILTYWSSKWFLIKYCSIPRLSHRLGKLLNDLTTTFPCIFTIGYMANLYMVQSEIDFDKRISLFIAIGTIVITLLFLLFANTVAEWFVTQQYQQLQNMENAQEQIYPNDFQQKNIADYRQLNPTTFLHSDIHDQINKCQFQSVWENLQSYAFQKQVSHLKRNSYFIEDDGNESLRSQRNSKSNKSNPNV